MESAPVMSSMHPVEVQPQENWEIINDVGLAAGVPHAARASPSPGPSEPAPPQLSGEADSMRNAAELALQRPWRHCDVLPNRVATLIDGLEWQGIEAAFTGIDIAAGNGYFWKEVLSDGFELCLVLREWVGEATVGAALSGTFSTVATTARGLLQSAAALVLPGTGATGHERED